MTVREMLDLGEMSGVAAKDRVPLGAVLRGHRARSQEELGQEEGADDETDNEDGGDEADLEPFRGAGPLLLRLFHVVGWHFEGFAVSGFGSHLIFEY